MQTMPVIFGRTMIPIHPFDMYDLIKNRGLNVSLPKQIGETGIPVMLKDGSCYLANAPILEFDGVLYLETTTVQPSETCSLK